VLLAGVQTVTVKTTTGDVEVGATAGPIDVATTRGKVRAQLVGAVHSVRVFTVSGDVILQVPPNLGAELGITTTSGIVNTRGLTMRDAEQTRFGLKATVNDGGVPIEVTSTTGAVTVTTHDIGPATIRAISPPGRTAPVTPAVEAPPPPAPEPTPPPAPAPAPATMEQPAAPAAPPAAEGAAPDTSGARGPAAGQPGQ